MYLDRIVATKHQEIEKLRSELTIADAERKIAEMPACLGFARKLREQRNRQMGLIAEVKKASPSKGLIRPDFHPVELAKAYEAAGADCLSVLTDKLYFQGSNEYLQAVRQAVANPLLRKDFTLDPLQVYEARLIGADAILLIAAILSTEEMQSLHNTAVDLGMDVLVEVHDREELERVLTLDGVQLIGVNNRNLRTFETNLLTTVELSRMIPQDVLLVSESGISKPAEITELYETGARAVLVGEFFMRQPDVEAGVHRLMGPLKQGAGQ